MWFPIGLWMLGVGEPRPVDFTFAGTGFYQRFLKGGLREYTPKGQSDLKKWTEMFTVNEYPKVTSGEGLAQAANSVLTTYEKAPGQVLRTNSVPRTAKSEAEHLIVVFFRRNDFCEVSMTRFLMYEKMGFSLVYSRRAYGKKAADDLAAWLKSNGVRFESELMKVKKVPGR